MVLVHGRRRRSRARSASPCWTRSSGERLQANALAVGTHLRARLRGLVERHALAGAAHGVGLYLGLELVRDRETLEPATEEAEAICERLRELGVIVQPTGDGMNVLKIKPPLCLTRADADFLADRLDEALGRRLVACRRRRDPDRRRR